MSEALRILSERFARGEITAEDYERSRGILDSDRSSQLGADAGPDTQTGWNSSRVAPVDGLARLVWAAAAIAIAGSAMYAAQLAVAPRDGDAGLESLRLATGEAASAGLAISALGDFACAVLSLWWMYRATANLHARHLPGLKVTPAWSVGWWFVPVAFFVMPYRAVRQLWDRSRTAEGHAILRIWWALLLIYVAGSGAIAYFAPVALENRAAHAVPLYLNSAVGMEFIHMGAAALWGMTVARISGSQSAWLSPSDKGTVPALTGWRDKAAPVALALMAVLLARTYRAAVTPEAPSAVASAAGWSVLSEKDGITDATIWKIRGFSSAVHGDSAQPARLTFSCGNTVEVYIRFGVPLADAFPDGDADMVAGILRLDDGEPARLGFIPTRDWLAVTNIAEGPLGAFAGAITSLGSSMLSTSGSFSTAWTPRDLARAMSGSSKMLFRVDTRAGGEITAHFDLSDFAKAYAEWPQHCRGSQS